MKHIYFNYKDLDLVTGHVQSFQRETEGPPSIESVPFYFGSLRPGLDFQMDGIIGERDVTAMVAHSQIYRIIGKTAASYLKLYKL